MPTTDGTISSLCDLKAKDFSSESYRLFLDCWNAYDTSLFYVIFVGVMIETKGNSLTSCYYPRIRFHDYLSNKYLPTIYYVSGTVLCIGIPKKNKVVLPSRFVIHWEDR